MKRFFKVLFFACGWTGLLLNLIFVLVSITRDPAIETSAIGTALELLWIGGCTFRSDPRKQLERAGIASMQGREFLWMANPGKKAQRLPPRRRRSARSLS